VDGGHNHPLFRELEFERIEPAAARRALVHLRSRVRAVRGEERADVVDWGWWG
jgi:hypothetical protein